MQTIYKNQKTKSAEASLRAEPITKGAIITILILTLFINLTSSASVWDIQRDSDFGEALCQKVISVNNEEAGEPVMLCPGGMTFGVKIKTKGLIVMDVVQVMTESGMVSPGENAGLMAGDVITRVLGKEVDTAQALALAFEKSEGRDLVIEIERNGESMGLIIKPVLSCEDNIYRGGLYVRDTTAGIGTITYIDPQSGSFAGLGHGICEVSSSEPIPIKSGEVCDVIISRVVKGRKGKPGELRGCLGIEKSGELFKNCHTGVYGKLYDIPKESVSGAVPVATKNQVKEGKAHILCTTDENRIEKYEINITKIQFDKSNTRNFSIRVTDGKLIEKTGGIVQGMSGSPIIQDGRLIGAVTHVLLEDPTTGYGIFIGNMLSGMQG